MEKKINNWADYEKLFKEERYNVSKIEDAYVYKLQEEIISLRAEVIEANENATWWKNRFNAVNAQMYGYGGAHQHFFVEPEKAKDILEETKCQSILLPTTHMTKEEYDEACKKFAFQLRVYEEAFDKLED